ncbi:hypothetical protein VTO73DRAFT_13397 [Trametes versicolor]
MLAASDLPSDHRARFTAALPCKPRILAVLRPLLAISKAPKLRTSLLHQDAWHKKLVYSTLQRLLGTLSTMY